MHVDPRETQAHQDLVEDIDVESIQIGVLLHVTEVLQVRVGAIRAMSCSRTMDCHHSVFASVYGSQRESSWTGLCT
jgi:hypothetical protein